jgi:NAD-dependent SIR2 family protein deacetylase
VCGAARVHTSDSARAQRNKDPEAPKRPKTAYLCFVTQNMERLREQTGKPQKEIMRMLGEHWKARSSCCSCLFVSPEHVAGASPARQDGL